MGGGLAGAGAFYPMAHDDSTGRPLFGQHPHSRDGSE
jgi:hypothetical protein